MKKLWKLFFQAIFLVFTCQSIIAQNWFDGTPNWSYTYDWWCFNPVHGWDKLKYKQDTIIDGKNCKLFKYIGYRYYPFTTIEDDYWESNYILYEENNIVYRYQSNFHKLYDFNLAIGDTIITTLNTNEGDPTCENPLISIIDNIYTIELNGHELSVQKWKNLNNIEEYGEYFTIIEKVGAIGNFFLEMSRHWGCGLDHCHPFSFQCYVNPELGINYPENINCEQILPTTDLELAEPKTIVYPNPSEAVFYFQSNELINSVKLFDLHGKLLPIDYSNEVLDLSLQKSGIYFIQLVYENGAFEVQKIVKN